MGKDEEELNLTGTDLDAEGTTPGSSNGRCLGCRRFREYVSLRCAFVSVLACAVLLSVVFWLPFFRTGNRKDLDLDYGGHDIVASFMLQKPASFLQDYILQLEEDIFDEMSFPSTKVEIISLESTYTPNMTKVVFAVESDMTTRSLIKANLLSLITRQSLLHLTDAYLFGVPFEFDILKFIGGITVSPEQKAFLMQKVQILFNFTLSFSIDEILVNFDQLRSQLDTGLHLSQYENLYITLTNLKGSTVSPPTTVQSQVLLAVGVDPSNSRLKQLAQTITKAHTKNLGLNNTVFGRVKQVRLSSILQHSLGGDLRAPSSSPSPSPMPSSNHHRRHHHHHKVGPAPNISPSPSRARVSVPTGSPGPIPGPTPGPTPGPRMNKAPPLPPPPDNLWKHNGHPCAAPYASPSYAPSLTPKSKGRFSPPPMLAPVRAASAPGMGHGGQPPSRGEAHARPPNVMSMISSPSTSPSSAGILSYDILALLLFILVAGWGIFHG